MRRKGRGGGGGSGSCHPPTPHHSVFPTWIEIINESLGPSPSFSRISPLKPPSRLLPPIFLLLIVVTEVKITNYKRSHHNNLLTHTVAKHPVVHWLKRSHPDNRAWFAIWILNPFLPKIWTEFCTGVGSYSVSNIVRFTYQIKSNLKGLKIIIMIK